MIVILNFIDFHLLVAMTFHVKIVLLSSNNSLNQVIIHHIVEVGGGRIYINSIILSIH